MATRENQGLQIALILFVMITVALAISTYVYFRKSEERSNEAVAANQSAQQANQVRDRVILENQKLKEFIGWPMETQLAEIETGYNNDMTQFGADYPADEPKNYRKLPAYLLGALRQRSSQVADYSVREKEQDAHIAQVEQREIAKTAEALKGRDDAIADRDAERTKFNADRTAYETKQQDFAKQLADKGKELTSLIAQHDQEIKQREGDLAKADEQSESLRQKLASLTQTTFETADGRITWVNQSSGKVWVNVGLLDGVRPQTAFKVYSPDGNSYDVANSKGTIEVLSVLDKHLAEARIISDGTSDPILPGDLIYTPLWRPGTNVRFALAGVIDLDGDGRSDRELVRNLITMNGGIVDAEVDQEGRRTGKMTVDTRYLVVGKRPTDATSQQALSGYSNMLTEAEGYGIEQITLDKLLDYLNYRGTERSVPLGRGANPDDFRAPPVEGVNRRSTGANAFQQRRPPQRDN